MRVSFVLATALAMGQAAVASPPACLLAALLKQSNPSNVEVLCKATQDAMIGNLTEVCDGAALTGAYDSYAATCSGVGVKVASLPAGSGQSSKPGGGGSSESDEKDGALAMSPPVWFVITGLMSTGLASVVFL